MAGDPFPPAARAEILGRGHGLCQWDLCGPATDTHHRRVKGMGGSSAADTNDPANGIGLAHGCHMKVHARPEAAMALGLLLPQGADPVEEPAFLLLPYGRRWYLLGPDGVAFDHDRPFPDDSHLTAI